MMRRSSFIYHQQQQQSIDHQPNQNQDHHHHHQPRPSSSTSSEHQQYLAITPSSVVSRGSSSSRSDSPASSPAPTTRSTSTTPHQSPILSTPILDGSPLVSIDALPDLVKEQLIGANITDSPSATISPRSSLQKGKRSYHQSSDQISPIPASRPWPARLPGSNIGRDVFESERVVYRVHFPSFASTDTSKESRTLKERRRSENTTGDWSDITQERETRDPMQRFDHTGTRSLPNINMTNPPTEHLQDINTSSMSYYSPSSSAAYDILNPSSASTANPGSGKQLGLRVEKDPFVGGTGFVGLTPTPSRGTFELASIQIPEPVAPIEQERAEATGSSGSLEEGRYAPPSTHEEESGYRRGYETYGASDRKSSGGSVAESSMDGRPMGHYPSSQPQAFVHQPQPHAATPMTAHHLGQTYIAHHTPPMQPYSYHLQSQPYLPTPMVEENHSSGPVSLPGFNQLYIDTPQQHMHQNTSRIMPTAQYESMNQIRLQPLQGRHLPHPGREVGQGHYGHHSNDPYGFVSPAQQQSRSPIVGYEPDNVQGDYHHVYAYPQNAAHAQQPHQQQQQQHQQHVAYPPHAFQTTPPSQYSQQMNRQTELQQVNGILGETAETGTHAAVPPVSNTNVFAYQYADGEEMDLDAPTPSLSGANLELGDGGQNHKDNDDSDTETEKVDESADEWIPESFKKKRTPKAENKSMSGRKSAGKKGKNHKSVSGNKTPTRKDGKKSSYVTSALTDTLPLPLNKTNKVMLKLPPLGSMGGNLIRWTSLAEEKQTDTVKRECFTCRSRDPPSWRKSTLSPTRILCNRCGIYERSHKRPRPLIEEEFGAADSLSTKKSKAALKRKHINTPGSLVTASQLRSSYAGGQHMAPAGYTSGGHAMYPSYGQENDARRVTALSGLPPGLTDPAGYTSVMPSPTYTKPPKKNRSISSRGPAPQEKLTGPFRTFTNYGSYGASPRMEPYQYALASHRSEMTSSVPLEKAHGLNISGVAVNRSASAMPQGRAWTDPYDDEDEED